MKRFQLLPTSNSYGYVIDDNRKACPAMFLTPREAKFQASFKSIREGSK